MNTPAWMNSVSLGTILVSVFVVLTVGGLVWMMLRPLLRSARRTDATLQELRRDWFGVEGRPGFPAVPGVPQRLLDVEQSLTELRPIVDRIEKEMRSNGGGSLRDQVMNLRATVEMDRTQSARDVMEIKTELGTFTRALDNARTLRALAAHAEQVDPDSKAV